jgi:monoamine oxidase
MARSPVFATLRRALRRAHVAQAAGRSPEELAARAAGPSRRDLLRIGAGAAALAPLSAFGAGCGDNVDGDAAVAVIGGGAAGLMAARALLAGGVDVTVYDASSRTGGRMFTQRGLFPDSKVVELGGELIDSDHAVMMTPGRTAHICFSATTERQRCFHR